MSERIRSVPKGWIVFIMAFVLYANTLSHDFTLDDAIVIKDNMYTTQGLSGWKGLLTKDTFHGFFKDDSKSQLVAGGRYRPLSPMLFALLYQVVGNSPFIFHLVNIILYATCCLLLFQLLNLFFKRVSLKEHNFIAFAATLLFTAHAVHTEVVANVKGADEILSSIGAILCLIYLIKWQSTQRVKFGIFACMAFFLSLLAKENTITLLAIAPMTLWMTSKNEKITFSWKHPVALLAVFMLYFGLRYAVLGSSIGVEAPKELLNNPFLKYDGNALVPFSFSERLGTILFCLFNYIKLLVFPHPLIHDYYPRHIPVINMESLIPWISLVTHVAVGLWALWKLRERNVVAYAVLFYLIAISITSNIAFPVGTTMSERFLFFPSIGFCIGAAFGLSLLKRKNKNIAVILLALLVILNSIKSISRNTVWKNNYLLFQTDVKAAPNSAKLQNAAAGSLIAQYETLQNVDQKKAKMEEAIQHAANAIRIHPRYKNAHLLKGNGHLYKEEFKEALTSYENALRLDPAYKEAKNNKQIALRAAGRYFGEKKGDIDTALNYLKQAHAMDKKNPETLRLLGVAYGLKGTHSKSIEYFSKLIDERPNNPEYWKLLGTAFHHNGQLEERDKVLAKAEELENPN